MDIVQHHLEKYFHHHTFQQGQEGIIRDVLQGNDVLGVLPTGSGKSLCYQLPATILSGLTVVISPLISLMIDQTRQIKAYHFKEVAALHSFQPMGERTSILKQLYKYKLLFLSPELLQQKEVLFRLKQVGVSLCCIDEAHCISQWGYDFRPDYLRLHTVLENLDHPPVLALTGTATASIQEDIIQQLARPSMRKHIYSIEKKNITFVVKRLTCNEDEKMTHAATYMEKLKKPALIYFSSRKKAEEMTTYLALRANIGRVAYYHAGMQAEDRLKVQEQFIYDQLDIVCCTSAFGMGINKGNIRTVLHYHPPAQLESFLQEVGRAGRDGKDSLSIVLYRKRDESIPLSMMENELPGQDELLFVFHQLKRLQAETKQLPSTKETLEEIFQMTETKWRLLQYQLERQSIINENKILPFDEKKWKAAYTAIDDFCTDRKQYKRRKINEMFQWLTTNACLRQQLYKRFQEDVSPQSENCCSNCDFHENEFHETKEAAGKLIEKSWRHRLKRLLLIEENEHVKPK